MNMFNSHCIRRQLAVAGIALCSLVINAVAETVSEPILVENALLQAAPQSETSSGALASSNSLVTPPVQTTADPLPIRVFPAEAADIVRNETGGQVMGVSTLRDGDRVIYGVKVLTEGRMRVIRVDSHSGSVLSSH